jgi:hypothetical protein
LLRDALDASNQRWDRYIVRYDIRRQLSLLERFENASNQTSSGPGLPRPRHLLALGGGLLVLLLVLALLRRRRPVRLRTRRATDSPVPAPGALLAVQLYEALENAMAMQGLGRPQGVPPLQHAQSSAVQRHPLGGEILELTRRYQELRFGGASLPEEQRRDIELRIKQLRAYRTAPRA